jgi:triphosphoribosyl-dephospho-CoA synthase
MLIEAAISSPPARSAPLPGAYTDDRTDRAWHLADVAIAVLIEEARLTPKPGLVDRRGGGAHADMTLPLLQRSALALRPTFARLARCAAGRRPDRALRERLARIGRDGERAMLAATCGVNTHRGAIWALGLLVAAAAIAGTWAPAARICALAGAIAREPDRFAPPETRTGATVCMRYQVGGALWQAQAGFPHVMRAGLPMLWAARSRCVPENCARLDALLAVMAGLDDTCLLHRGGPAALDTAQNGAEEVATAGGTSTPAGRRALDRLDRALLSHNASPGGSADLLAAALFLDRLDRPRAWSYGETE